MSDHLLAVLGQLDSKKALLERLELINTFCKVNSIQLSKVTLYNCMCVCIQAVVADAVNGTGELICKTSVLIFFSVRPGDIEMKRFADKMLTFDINQHLNVQTHAHTIYHQRHNSELEDSFNFLAEESEGTYINVSLHF